MTEPGKAKESMDNVREAMGRPGACNLPSRTPGDWDSLFASLDSARLPEDYLNERVQGLTQVRDEI